MCTPSLTTKLTDVNGNIFNVQGPPRWISMETTTLPNNDNIAHLGIKVVCDPNDGTTEPWFDVYETLLIEFRTKL